MSGELFSNGYAYVPEWLLEGEPRAGWRYMNFNARKTDEETGMEWFRFLIVDVDGRAADIWIPAVLLASEYMY